MFHDSNNPQYNRETKTMFARMKIWSFTQIQGCKKSYHSTKMSSVYHHHVSVITTMSDNHSLQRTILCLVNEKKCICT